MAHFCDFQYLDNAAEFVKKIEEYLRVPETGGYASLEDVNSTPPGFIDDTERFALPLPSLVEIVQLMRDLSSFFFAEVLKYLYLTFDDPAHVSLDECTSRSLAYSPSYAIYRGLQHRSASVHRAKGASVV